MTTYEYSSNYSLEELEIAAANTAIFDQYDDLPVLEAANDDEFDNLYPYIG